MSKRQTAIAIFNAQLATKAELGDTKFRAQVIQTVMKETDSSHSGAAAMYNHAKKKAQEAGLTQEFGRVLDEEARYIAMIDKQELAELEEEFDLEDWAVVGADNVLIDTFTSKTTAYRARNSDAGEQVFETASLDIK